MMQENNNFSTIISNWRRMSAEQGEVSVSMSGDSSDYQMNKKKEDEALLVPEKVKGPIATAASAGAVAAIAEAPNELANNLEEKLLCRDKDDCKEAAGDGMDDKDKDSDYLENNDIKEPLDRDELKTPETNHKVKSTDKVDSFTLSSVGEKSAPGSNPNEKEKEDCFLVCLYYTLECCDCVLM